MDLTESQEQLLQVAQTRSHWRLRDVLTVEELASFLSVSVRSIRRIEADGQGPPRQKRQHRLVYPVPELLRWLPTFQNRSVEQRGRNTKAGRALTEHIARE